MPQTWGQSVQKIFSASLLVSKQNRLRFYSWHDHDFHINTFIRLIHVVKQVHKISGKCLKTNTKISLKNIFLFPCIIFKVNFQSWGSEMPSCNITPYQWCVYWAWVKTSYIIQLNWLYLNYKLVPLSPSEAPVASEIVRELGWFRVSQDANTAQKFP